MKILYVHAPDNSSHPGGIETYARELIMGIRSRGHSVEEIITDPEVVMKSLRPVDHIPTPRYWHRFFFWRGIYYQDYRYHRAIHQSVTKCRALFKPDLIHTFHVYQLGALDLKRVSSVVTCHGLEIEDNSLVRTSLKLAQGIHCNSNFTRGLVEKVNGSTSRLRVLSWGIFPGMKQSASPFTYDLITISRLVRRKNIESVIRAVAGLPDVRYAIAGAGPQLDPLKQLVEALRLQNVVFFGEISEQRKWELLQQSKVFIMCPRRDLANDVEGLGLVYFEAHAAGVPVIGAHSGGVHDAVGDGGVLVADPLDVEEIRSAIRHTLKPKNHIALVDKVKQRQQTHTWDKFVQSFEQWYAQLVGEARRQLQSY